MDRDRVFRPGYQKLGPNFNAREMICHNNPPSSMYTVKNDDEQISRRLRHGTVIGSDVLRALLHMRTRRFVTRNQCLQRADPEVQKAQFMVELSIPFAPSDIIRALARSPGDRQTSSPGDRVLKMQGYLIWQLRVWLLGCCGFYGPHGQ